MSLPAASAIPAPRAFLTKTLQHSFCIHIVSSATHVLHTYSVIRSSAVMIYRATELLKVNFLYLANIHQKSHFLVNDK